MLSIFLFSSFKYIYIHLLLIFILVSSHVVKAELGESKWSMDDVDTSDILKAAVTGALHELIEGRCKGGGGAMGIVRSTGIKMAKGAGQNAFQTVTTQIIKKQRIKRVNGYQSDTSPEAVLAYLRKIYNPNSNSPSNEKVFKFNDPMPRGSLLSQPTSHLPPEGYVRNHQVNTFAYNAITRYDTRMNRQYVKK